MPSEAASGERERSLRWADLSAGADEGGARQGGGHQDEAQKQVGPRWVWHWGGVFR